MLLLLCSLAFIAAASCWLLNAWKPWDEQGAMLWIWAIRQALTADLCFCCSLWLLCNFGKASFQEAGYFYFAIYIWKRILRNVCTVDKWRATFYDCWNPSKAQLGITGQRGIPLAAVFVWWGKRALNKFLLVHFTSHSFIRNCFCSGCFSRIEWSF